MIKTYQKSLWRIAEPSHRKVCWHSISPGPYNISWARLRSVPINNGVQQGESQASLTSTRWQSTCDNPSGSQTFGAPPCPAHPKSPHAACQMSWAPGCCVCSLWCCHASASIGRWPCPAGICMDRNGCGQHGSQAFCNRISVTDICMRCELHRLISDP